MLAITGHVACGKSTAAEMLESLGWEVIDADHIVHELYLPEHPGYKKIIDAFGTSILKRDRTIDRASLARIVFFDSLKLQQLNSLIHPLVRELIQERLVTSLNLHPHRRIVCVIPLLFEANHYNDFDNIVCVGASISVQKERLKARGLSSDEIEKRLLAQWPMEKKIEKSNYVVWNNGSLEHFKSQIMHLHYLQA